MKNTQLRTGNLILYKGEVKTVDGILRGHICLFEHSKDGKYGDWIDLDEIEFIPLTEYWLIKLGLVSIEIGYYQINEGVSIDVENQVRYESSWMTECIYVHQLQNLYYAITGSDLTKTP